MNSLMADLARELGQGRPVVEALVCEHSGSTPRSSGAGMLVFGDGSFAGSVGGGLLEAQVLEAAHGLLNSRQAPDTPAHDAMLLAFDFSNNQAAQAGMICGGRLRVFLQRIHPDQESAAVYTAAAKRLQAGRREVVLCDLGQTLSPPLPDAQPLHIAGRRLLDPGQDEDALATAARQATREGGAGLLDSQGRTWLAAPYLENGTLVLVGAGHVAQHTARAAAAVGFTVRVLDDRAEFANAERFPDAAEVIVLDSFEHCFAKAPLDAGCYVVVVTRGHAHDKTVLAQALRSPAAYLGMIGSKGKRDAIYAALEKEGFAAAEFERVHCPIGLSIGAETPEEIAVSITAELIQARALRRGSAKVGS